MKAWVHGESTDQETLERLGFNLVNFYNSKCIFCDNLMSSVSIPDIWGHSPENYLKLYYKSIDINWMHYQEGVSLKHLELADGDPGSDIYCTAHACKVCGWWVLEKKVLLNSKSTQIWELILATAGVLNNFDLTDLSLPVEEIKKYLTAKYDSRFSLNPKKYEDVVASVFKNLGYSAQVTGYSSDGGIDVILNNSDDNFIGVQVKRYKNKIKVEQIRSFIGALFINNYTNGIFVTTSDFQSGASKLAKSISDKTYSVELLNAKRFYEALKLSQVKSFSDEYPLNYLTNVPNLHPITSLHLNPL